MELCQAVYCGDIEKVRGVLYKRGYDYVNYKDKCGSSPLHSACLFRHLEVAKFLVEKGADVDVRSSEDKTTPLENACLCGYAEFVEFLVKHGANVRTTNPRGITPLHIASRYGHTEIVDFLIRSDAEINARDADQWHPLDFAICFDHVEIVKLLVNAGADVDAISGGFQRTPVQRVLAVEHKHSLSILQALMAGEPDLLAVDGEGNTTFMLAGNGKLAKCLLEHQFLVESRPQKMEDKKLDWKCYKVLFQNNVHNCSPLQFAKDKLNDEDVEVRNGWSEKISYLESFITLQLAVSSPISLAKAGTKRKWNDNEPSVTLNPRLTEMQQWVAKQTYNLLVRTPVHSVVYSILGYLSPADVMVRTPEFPYE
mmetsp:Transcript_20859/g.23830  ORF Transcript_20859/g.23830 Transcript_20859/m.23830 type:complete len:368 (-) Transcript_20859:197-1300(-)|eukprot:CAMPEP_0194137484 /NCGR_PEP_ID=MMETSP0152-20130528/7382_1 /TAXON_ID=1049557 /ORGANISM="Thalassiothrix antarctica, Strain L6-D1" /LENGTH=367 /DNA_ID=CAMNT_0038834521 /DNA_START=40 /DNA_END=1143 /DNA_ORIENTATION=-